jgi:hypothetical protein
MKKSAIGELTIEDMKKQLIDKNIKIIRTNLFGRCRAVVRKMNDGYLIPAEVQK